MLGTAFVVTFESSFLGAWKVLAVVELGTVSRYLRGYSGLQGESEVFEDMLDSKRANVLCERARVWPWMLWMGFVGIAVSNVSNL
jgi:hypothetical protein